METIVAGVIVALAILASSLLSVYLLNRLSKIDKQESYNRQDAQAEISNGKLDIIHSLVNSNMTTALQAELDATARELAMMKEVIELKRHAGIEPSPEVLVALENTQDRISKLLLIIEDRLAPTNKE